MHMSNVLITPGIGGAMIVIAAGVTAYSINKSRRDEDFESKIPLMGVVGAFAFAAQMINFTIPGTGSSGHIGGGVLLGAILGPEAGFLSILSIVLIQCLLFGDGGLLALGCNVINIGFFGCFMGYKLIYSKIMANGYSKKKIMISSIISVVVGLQLGALGVVIETVASGVTELPLSKFLLFMQPIHLAIGLVEGILTGVVLNYVWDNRPDILEKTKRFNSFRVSRKKLTLVFLGLALIGGIGMSLFASSNPDGLEWSILKTSGIGELESSEPMHEVLAEIQETTTILPDYGFGVDNPSNMVEKLGTMLSGATGVVMTIGFVVILGYITKGKATGH